MLLRVSHDTALSDCSLTDLKLGFNKRRKMRAGRCKL
jgi:hypothetical protein